MRENIYKFHKHTSNVPLNYEKSSRLFIFKYKFAMEMKLT